MIKKREKLNNSALGTVSHQIKTDQPATLAQFNKLLNQKRTPTSNNPSNPVSALNTSNFNSQNKTHKLNNSNKKSKEAAGPGGFKFNMENWNVTAMDFSRASQNDAVAQKRSNPKGIHINQNLGGRKSSKENTSKHTGLIFANFQYPN